MCGVLIVISAVSGCANGPVEDCQIFGPIYPTAQDADMISDDLVEQLLRHNETGAALCGWDK